MIVVWLVFFGALGVLVRYGVSQYLAVSAFPMGTLVVNAVGSLLIGVCFSLQMKNGTPLTEQPLLLALMVGFLGALTTFSTFSLETIKLLQQSALGLAALNVLLNNLLAIGCCYLGMRFSV